MNSKHTENTRQASMSLTGCDKLPIDKAGNFVTIIRRLQGETSTGYIQGGEGLCSNRCQIDCHLQSFYK